MKVDVLQPHQAEDWMSEAGRSFGVCATHNRDMAIAFALGAVPDESGSVSRVIRKQDLNPVKMVYVRVLIVAGLVMRSRAIQAPRKEA
jgi:hypothetical protein